MNLSKKKIELLLILLMQERRKVENFQHDEREDPEKLEDMKNHIELIDQTIAILKGEYNE